jgi:putative oxidoreductase
MPPLPETVQMHAVQFAVAWGELVGGLALILGLLTRLAAVGLLIIQVGAIYTVTFAKGFSVAAGGGYEYNVSLMAGCLALALMGAGTFAFDHWLMQRDEAKKATPAAT